MSETFFYRIIFHLKKALGFPGRKAYLIPLIEHLEQQKDKGEVMPFKIFLIKSKGFVVKVGGLFAYGSFDHMPWQYQHPDAWKVVFPYLTDRIFYCKIHMLDKDPLCIIVNGNIPQFRKPELKQNDLYIGIILYKVSYGLFIDIGFHFGWEYGSLVGMLHVSACDSKSRFNQAEAGQTVEVHFLGYHDHGQLVFGNRPVLEEWFTGELSERIGELVWVKVTKGKDARPVFKVEACYDAILPLTERLYHGRIRKVEKAVRNLANGDIIRCEVIGLDTIRRTVELKWALEWEIDSMAARADKTWQPHQAGRRVETREPLQNLHLIGKKVQVMVSVTTDRNGHPQLQYLVENKYKGKLLIENATYRLTRKERAMFEQNLKDGEILECEVTGIDKEIITVKWVIP